METTNTTCPCDSKANKCKMMKGGFVILFGLLFLVKAFGGVSAETTNIIWPILVIIAGLGKFCPCKNCAGSCGACSK